MRQKNTQQSIEKDLEKFAEELESFLSKSKGIQVEKLAEREQAPYYFDTGNYALNWILTDDFFKGLPGTKSIQVAGECIGSNTLLRVKANKDFYSAEEITAKELFDKIQIYQKQLFDLDILYDVNENIDLKILNENDEWVKINKVIIKEKEVREIFFENNYSLICSNEHLIFNGKECVKAQDLKENEICGNLRVIKNLPLNRKEIVYDFQVESESHLYKDAFGVIHHNSGKGKSLICDHFLGNVIRAGGLGFKVEIEDAGGREFTANIIGDKEIAERIRIIEPKIDDKGNIKPITIEKLTVFLNKLVEFQISKKSNKPILVVIDSISQLTSEKEFEDIKKERDTKDMTVQQKMRAFFRVLTPQQRLANLTIIGIAHLTANIGNMFGPKMVMNSKGSGFKYASSLDIEIKSNKELKGEADVTIGQMLKFKTTKNRFTYKGREVWVKFYNVGGIDRYSGLTQILSKFGIIKASAKPDVNGLFKDSVTFTWNDIKFKEHEIKKVVEENGGENLLKEWMNLLNEKLYSIYKREGLAEESILLDDESEQDYAEDILEQIEND